MSRAARLADLRGGHVHHVFHRSQNILMGLALAALLFSGENCGCRASNAARNLHAVDGNRVGPFARSLDRRLSTDSKILGILHSPAGVFHVAQPGHHPLAVPDLGWPRQHQRAAGIRAVCRQDAGARQSWSRRLHLLCGGADHRLQQSLEYVFGAGDVRIGHARGTAAFRCEGAEALGLDACAEC
jgi:hypothetical protein